MPRRGSAPTSSTPTRNSSKRMPLALPNPSLSQSHIGRIQRKGNVCSAPCATDTPRSSTQRCMWGRVRTHALMSMDTPTSMRAIHRMSRPSWLLLTCSPQLLAR
eukprot:2028542-Prymnesium_polylepis.1